MEPLSLDDIAEFTWMWTNIFFLETNKGNYLWSDPDYGGDNTIKKYPGSLEDYCRETNTPYGRDKGKHFISDYCGLDVRIE